MFSWSQTANKRQSGGAQYPGRRNQRKPSTTNGIGGFTSNNTTAAAAATATVVQGSIRPPPGAATTMTNGSSSTSRHSSPLTRAQHLESYLEDSTLSRSTRRVSSDDTTYDTVFQTTHGETLIVRVHVPLTSSFASPCPAMSLAGVRAVHPWIAAATTHNSSIISGSSSGSSSNSSSSNSHPNMRITGYAPIQSDLQWKQSGLTLGQAVHSVVQHFQLNPPEILEIIDPGLRSIQKRQSTTTGNVSHVSTSTTTKSTKNIPASPPSYDDTVQGGLATATATATAVARLPPAPEPSLPILPRNFETYIDEAVSSSSSPSSISLEDLASNQLEFLSLVHSIPEFQEIHQVGQSLSKEVKQMAQENIDLVEKELKPLQTEEQRLQKIFQTKLETFQSLEKQQNTLCAPPDTKMILRNLKEAKKQALEESEAFAEAWVEQEDKNDNDNNDDNGHYDVNQVDTFCKEFIRQRKVHHERAAKMELLMAASRQ